MLEVVDKGSSTESHPVPLLFVHGGCLAAWCWDDHFLDFFADNGYRAIALNLRGHGGSPVSKPLNKCTLADYVDDVRSVAATLPATPVLIGHSMGGFIVQKYLETGTTPAAVLGVVGTAANLVPHRAAGGPEAPVAGRQTQHDA
jgi:pimeloyl-ACP methyl ester carboxylesterase